MRIRNINPAFGDPVIFDSVEEMQSELIKLGYMPDDGLREGRDYEQTTLCGKEAIDYARDHGRMLSKLNDPLEWERVQDVTPDEAEQMLRDNLPDDHIYLDV